MIYRILSVTTLLLCAIGVTYAQGSEDFRPGYVVTPDGDTLVGEIARAQLTDLVYQVRFRPSDDQAATSYEPEDISEFGFDNRLFVSRTVALQDDGEPRSRFLLILERGALTLMAVVADQKEYFFIEADHFPIAQLRPPEEEVDMYARELQRTRPYVGTLIRALYPCPEVQERAAGVGFGSHHLARIVRAYNSCMGGPSESVRLARPVGVSVRFAVRGGVGVSRLYYDILGTSDARLVPYVGLVTEVGLPRLFGGFSVMLEASYMQKGRAQDGYFANHHAPQPEDFESDYFALQLGARYQMPLKPVSAYATIGVFASHIPGESREVITWTAYRPQRNDGGIFAELGMALPQRQVGEITLGLRLERANTGTMSPVDFRGPLYWPVKSYTAVLVAGVRF